MDINKLPTLRDEEKKRERNKERERGNFRMRERDGKRKKYREKRGSKPEWKAFCESKHDNNVKQTPLNKSPVNPFLAWLEKAIFI